MLWSPALAQVPAARGSQLPTLAPTVKETAPSVVNISVQARVKEDNPLYRDPVFREFFDLPKQLEKKVQATGSGVIVDAERGYVLTANHVVAQISSAQVTTRDGRKFAAKLVGRDPATDIAVLQLQGTQGRPQGHCPGRQRQDRSRRFRHCDRQPVWFGPDCHIGDHQRCSDGPALASKAMKTSSRPMHRSIPEIRAVP